MGKTIGWTLKHDIHIAAGPVQVATGVESGMRTIFEDEQCEAVTLVDASNAFNALNPNVAFHNVQYTCPYFATLLISTYRKASRLILQNETEILSQEETT